MYPYHNKIKQRINNGELIGIEESDKNEFAFMLVFNTPPFKRPIRHHSAYKYFGLITKK